ncbi:MAG: NfeD family protein [bacterium]|nr:NfeD family protein [bacterium]
MLLEFVLPGLVVIFLGFGALLVSLGLYAGWIEGWMQALLSWFVVSTLLVLMLRELLLKLAPTGEVSKVELDRDQDWQGQVVAVVEEISPGAPGRISFQDSTWTAISEGETIPQGARAQLLEKRGMAFVVGVISKK